MDHIFAGPSSSDETLPTYREFARESVLVHTRSRLRCTVQMGTPGDKLFDHLHSITPDGERSRVVVWLINEAFPHLRRAISTHSQGSSNLMYPIARWRSAREFQVWEQQIITLPHALGHLWHCVEPDMNSPVGSNVSQGTNRYSRWGMGFWHRLIICFPRTLTNPRTFHHQTGITVRQQSWAPTFSTTSSGLSGSFVTIQPIRNLRDLQED
jgi:hypothetical protein